MTTTMASRATGGGDVGDILHDQALPSRVHRFGAQYRVHLAWACKSWYAFGTPCRREIAISLRVSLGQG
jgi:hypothetical protein